MLHSSTPRYRDEPQENYRLGGYHPMKLGETVASPNGATYEVIRKLGWGEYSTVWLVQSQTGRNYAAMKVLKAEVTDLPVLHEREYLRRILTADPTHPGFQHIVHLLDDFHIQGPNGKHLCLVTELLGESLNQYARRFPRGQVPIAIAKTVLKQVILALMYLHEQCNIIHTDLKINNILLVLPEGDVPGVSSTRSPTSIESPVESLTSDSPTVKLIDLGVACWADRVEEHWTDLIQSPELRAPEVVVGAGWGTPADVWSLGCLMYELATGKFLFSHTVHELSMAALHEMRFGPYPSGLIKRGQFSSFFFKDDGSPLYPNERRAPLAGRIGNLYRGPDPEGLTQFLQKIFSLDPQDRPSLRELSEDPWLSAI